MTMFELGLRFRWFFPKVRNDDILALAQKKAWRRPGDKPLSERMVE